MFRSSVELRSELDPDDSISRRGISDECFGDPEDQLSGTAGTTTLNVTSSHGDYIYVKDDKYESNTKHLEGILGVALSSL